jgi:aminomethyltransferase
LHNGTPFYPRLSTLTETPLRYEWASMLLVPVFTSIEDELRALREAATITDMSPLFKFEVRGAGAARFVDSLVTKDTSRLQPGGAVYTPWCADDGHVIADGIVFRVAEELYRISGPQNLAWFREVAERIGADVEIADVSAAWAILSLQGPRSREILERASGEQWGDLKFSRLRSARVGGVDVDLSRQGFTGELGYELWVAADDALPLLDAALEAGRDLGLQAAGTLAIDVARVEAGLVLVYADFTPAAPGSALADPGADDGRVTPYALGMDPLVSLDKETDFVGRAALQEIQRSGDSPRLVGLKLDWAALSRLFERHGRPAVVRAEVQFAPFEVEVDGARVGRATSVTWSPSIGALIGFGQLSPEHAEIGSRVDVRWDRDGAHGLVPAEVVPIPFVKLRRAES